MFDDHEHFKADFVWESVQKLPKAIIRCYKHDDWPVYETEGMYWING